MGVIDVNEECARSGAVCARQSCKIYDKFRVENLHHEEPFPPFLNLCFHFKGFCLFSSPLLSLHPTFRLKVGWRLKLRVWR